MMVSSWNGFSMKSEAPAFMASIAMGTSACPVMTITGTEGCSLLHAAGQVAAMPGMRT